MTNSVNMADVKELKKEEEAMEVVEEKQGKTSIASELSEKDAEGSETKMNGNSHEPDIEAMKKKATQLLLLGKRNILIRDFQAAIASLAECCQLSKEIYGEDADDLGDPYYYYGKALFELARNESKVLGEQNEEGDDDDDEDDEEEEEGDDEDEDSQNDEGKNKEESNGDAKMEENKVEDKEENGKAEEDEAKDSDPSTNKENASATGGEAEDVNDLQLSWEYLELAKLIYQRKANECKDTAIKLAEVYLTLGENGLESDNYTTAIEDIKYALELQRKTLPEEDRRIAETLYHLGVAHSLNRKFDEAIENFKLAIEQLKKKITSLEIRKKEGDKKTEDEEKDAFYTMDGEIEDIRSIIKDIEEKITDMNDYKNQIRDELLKQVASGSGEGGSSKSASAAPSSEGASSSSSSVPVTDISHLVRKKRKNDSEDGNEAKKPKQENGA